MSLVLVDTSAWIDFFRDDSSPYGAVVEALLQEGLVCTTGLVKAEILPGARKKKEFNLLKEYFNALPFLTDPVDMWDKVIGGQRKLKQKGINGVGIPDLIVAVTALTHNVRVFSKDRHFDLMKKNIGLKLFEL
jgi:hypothetical protein